MVSGRPYDLRGTVAASRQQSTPIRSQASDQATVERFITLDLAQMVVAVIDPNKLDALAEEARFTTQSVVEAVAKVFELDPEGFVTGTTALRVIENLEWFKYLVYIMSVTRRQQPDPTVMDSLDALAENCDREWAAGVVFALTK